jgi:phosphate acetyltransferase
MARIVYVTSLGPGGGKSAIALGMAEVFSRRVRRLGVFRPLVRQTPDPVVELLRGRYQITVAVGPTYSHASELIGTNRLNDLISEILEAYYGLERECDAVIAVGTGRAQRGGGTRDKWFSPVAA